MCSEAGGGRPIDSTRECFDRAFAHYADEVLGQRVGRVDLADRLLELVEYVVLILGEIGGLLCQCLGPLARAPAEGHDVVGEAVGLSSHRLLADRLAP